MLNKTKCIYLKINSEYYAFLSGAFISIPLSLFLDIKDYLYNIFFWLSIFISTIASMLSFMLSIQVKTVCEKFEQAKKAYLKSEGGELAAWNAVVSDKSTKMTCIPLFYFMIITLVASLVCIILMQFVTADNVKRGQVVICLMLYQK